jgi:hypothetical protein
VERRKTTLARILSRPTSGMQLNEHLEHNDGALVFETPDASAWRGS